MEGVQDGVQEKAVEGVQEEEVGAREYRTEGWGGKKGESAGWRASGALPSCTVFLARLSLALTCRICRSCLAAAADCSAASLG